VANEFEKNEHMFNRFDTILACDRQTGRQTGSLRHNPRYAYTSRGKNQHLPHTRHNPQK